MSTSHTKTYHLSKTSSCCLNHLPLPSASELGLSPEGTAQLRHQACLLQGLHSPVLTPLFLQSYTALPPRPHLLELVDLADEEVPIASSNLCVCDVDHVLGREHHEVRKKSALAGRQQALPNRRSNQRGSLAALVQCHTYRICASPTAIIPFSVGCLLDILVWDVSQIHTVFTSPILAHSACFCLSFAAV